MAGLRKYTLYATFGGVVAGRGVVTTHSGSLAGWPAGVP